MGSSSGGKDWSLKSAGADRKTLNRPGEHRRPRGIGGTRPGRISFVWNVTTPLESGDIHVVGKPTVRKARFSSGRRMAQEANAGGRKAAGNRDVRGRLLRRQVSYNRPDTGIARPERALTWAR